MGIFSDIIGAIHGDTVETHDDGTKTIRTDEGTSIEVDKDGHQTSYTREETDYFGKTSTVTRDEHGHIIDKR